MYLTISKAFGADHLEKRTKAQKLCYVLCFIRHLTELNIGNAKPGNTADCCSYSPEQKHPLPP